MHRGPAIVLTIVALAAGSGSAAVPRPHRAQGAVVLTNGDVGAALAADVPGGRTAHAIAPADAFRYWAVIRTRAGSVERHDEWVDVTVIRSGSGVLYTGVRVAGSTETAPGEWRGGHIRDARRHTIAAGDIVVIPAGTAHQLVPAAGAPLVYVTIKVPATRRDTRPKTALSSEY